MTELERRALLGDKIAQEECTEKGVLFPCPWCKKHAVFIGVHDDEGNYHGRLRCDYEENPWSGLTYSLHHEGWGNCILSTDGEYQAMGGVMFDTAQEAIKEWNRYLVSFVGRCKDCAKKEDAYVNDYGILVCPTSGMEIDDEDFCSYFKKCE